MRNITEVNDIILEIKSYLLKLYKARIKYLIVYGSFARNEATEDSDIDLLVVVDDELDPLEVEDSLNDFLFKILLERGELISIMAIPEGIFKNYNSPFLINAREDGVSL